MDRTDWMIAINLLLVLACAGALTWMWTVAGDVETLLTRYPGQTPLCIAGLLLGLGEMVEGLRSK